MPLGNKDTATAQIFGDVNTSMQGLDSRKPQVVSSAKVRKFQNQFKNQSHIFRRPPILLRLKLDTNSVQIDVRILRSLFDLLQFANLSSFLNLELLLLSRGW